MSAPQQASAFAPASIGNVAVGFDVLGLAIEKVGDQVVATRRNEAGVSISAVKASGFAKGAELLSREPTENTAGIAALELLADYEPGFGVNLEIIKGIPLGSGMGSSAASAVAAAAAVNALLPRPLNLEQLLSYALAGEAFASKASHADNVAPSLFGGLCFCPPRDLPNVYRLTLPEDVVSVVVHPGIRIDTAASRGALSSQCPLTTAVTQSGLLGGFVLACERNDRELLGRALEDVLVEPQRCNAIPAFASAKKNALAAGSYGFSISGSGPAVFALCHSDQAESVTTAIEQAFLEAGMSTNAWISSGQSSGVEIEVHV